MRENLDPFHNHDEEQINKALLDVHMMEAVRALPHGLDTTVAEGGLNFSVVSLYEVNFFVGLEICVSQVCNLALLPVYLFRDSVNYYA